MSEYVIREHEPAPCAGCGQLLELRHGYCWDCATPELKQRVRDEVQHADKLLLAPELGFIAHVVGGEVVSVDSEVPPQLRQCVPEEN